MADAGEEGVPVWGIDVGPDSIEAVRVVRRAEGGFYLLDHLDAPVSGPAPEALVSFLRKRRIIRHPLVVALRSPSTLFGTYPVPTDLPRSGADDERLNCLEHIHLEPERADIRWKMLSDDVQIICAEERSWIESFILALEGAQAPAYALVSGLDALTNAVRRSGVHEGDAVVLRIRRRWTDVLFLDGTGVSHLGLPTGAEDLEDESARQEFVEDVARYLDYHRTRVPREEPERFLVLGAAPPLVEKLAPLLPERPVPFPADAGPIRGRGKIGTMRGLEIVRESPDAVGAAIAGAAAPPRLELAFRSLPAELPAPPRPAATWLVASLLVWLALAIAWAGTLRELREVRGSAASPRGGGEPTDVTPENLDRLSALVEEGRYHAAFSRAVEDVFATLPAVGDAPFSTEELSIRRDGAGAYEIRLELTFPKGAGGAGSALRRHLAALGAKDVVQEADGRGGERILASWLREARR